MLKIGLTIITIIILMISISFVIRKRKKLGFTGFKTALTPICFYLIAINSLILVWLEKLGLLFWTINIILLFLAAYFTKFFPKSTQKES